MKKIPTRKCLATNQIYPKKDLFRVVKNKEGEVFLDISGKANGRGAYIGMNLECVLKAQKSKCLDRALDCSVPESVYLRMIKYLNMK